MNFLIHSVLLQGYLAPGFVIIFLLQVFHCEISCEFRLW